MRLASVLPVLNWGRDYNRRTFIDDFTAAIIITMMMIPQALAYALLAGLPPQVGLYASMLPLLLYAVFGSSSALSVGPFAISSIMTATALSAIFPDGDSQQWMAGAIVLALISGIMLLLFGVLRLGFLSNFLSFPVVTGFISASAVVIAVSQIDTLLGLQAQGEQLYLLLSDILRQLHRIQPHTLALGVGSMVLLKWLPTAIKKLAEQCGGGVFTSELLSKSTPLLVMWLSILLVSALQLEQSVAVIGDIPRGLPTLALPNDLIWDWPHQTWHSLLTSAALISLIGYVSALSVAQSFAAKRRQRIDPNQEAIGLGLANMGSGLSGAFPLSASLSRSAVSFNAGARTPAAGAFSAFGMMLSTLFLTPYLYHLPLATLSAMILLAVISLIDVDAMRRAWHYSRGDFAALALTAVMTLAMGVEIGLVSGVLLSIALHLYRSSNPHVAVVGKIPHSEHFRNRERHDVELNGNIIGFRVDASLYFANARFLEDQVNALVAEFSEAKHLVLLCSSISDIDSSALESLRAVDRYLRDAGMKLHLSEVKGPVMDRLACSDFLDTLSGNIYVSHYQAWRELKTEPQSDFVI